MFIYRKFTNDYPLFSSVCFDAEGGAGNEGETDAEKAAAVAAAADIAAKAAKPDAEFDAKVAAAAEALVAGLKTKNAELIATAKKLKEDAAAVAAAAKAKPALSDEEFTEYKTLKERIERDELLKMFAEGKSAEAIEAVTRRTRLEFEAKATAEAESTAKKLAEAGDWKSKYEETKINVEVARATATTVKPQYQELIAKLVADRVKLVDGTVRVVDANGEVELGNTGKPVVVADYIETLRATYSDLFVASSGGGAGGGKKTASGGGSAKMTQEQADGLSPEEFFKARAAGLI